MSAPGSALELVSVANGLLDEVVAWFAASDVQLPERQGVVPGAPGVIAWDCEQLTVALATITTGAISGQSVVLPSLGPPAGVALPRLGTWSIQIVRCTPNPDEDGNPPSSTALAAAAVAELTDAGLLSQCLIELASASGGSRAWLPIGGTVNTGGITALGPDGGFQGVEALVSLSAMQVG